jgi:prophage regulatory protein
MNERYLSDTDLAQRFAVSRVTVWRWTSEGLLPKPVRIGKGCTRWPASEIAEAEARWLKERGKLEGTG